MARVGAVQVATWVIRGGFTGLERTGATAVGIATGADPDAPGGVFGVGGTPGDGLAQAKAAHDATTAGGMAALPAYRTGRHIIYLPAAQAALTIAVGQLVADAIPNPVADAADTVKQTVSDVTAPLRYVFSTEAQERVGKFIIGTALIIVGAFVFATSGARRATRSGLEKAEAVGVTLLTLRGAASSATAAAAAAPKPRPKPAPPTDGRPGDEITRKLSPLVQRTRNILGAEQARRSGNAPYRGSAPRPATPLVNPGGKPVTKG